MNLIKSHLREELRGKSWAEKRVCNSIRVLVAYLRRENPDAHLSLTRPNSCRKYHRAIHLLQFKKET